MFNKLFYNLYFMLPLKMRGLAKKYIANREKGQMYSPTLRAIYKKQFNIEVGYGSYGGCFSERNVPSGVVFGNYCSVAPNIRIFRANHPVNSFTTHPLLYNPKAGHVNEDKLHRPSLLIGHDVWIGEWTIILPGVTKIGNGAIIGAGSVVTRDVPPYTIVAGNPAKVIKNRFDDETIMKLEASGWWKLSKSELIKNINLFENIAENNININK
jgi:acetyltransferase-like isoleucine patch superfamily enzyme